MIKCIAIDDEPLALKQLENYIKKTPFLQLSAACHSAAAASEILKNESVDVIFTDINMPDVSGLDFVKSLSNPPLVVFSTAYAEYAVEGFKIDAIDFLLKPYGYDDFMKAAMKVRQYLEWKNSSANAETVQNEERDFMFIRADNKSVKVFYDNILYIEAMSEYIRIHFKNGDKSLMTFMSVKLMAESLPAAKFRRIHRSYIVALDSIKSLQRSELELADGTILPVSASYKDDIQNYLENLTISRKGK